jgi:hypothetical protein
VIIGGTDSKYVPAPSSPGGLKVNLAATTVVLPLAGGPGALSATPAPLHSENRMVEFPPGWQPRLDGPVVR